MLPVDVTKSPLCPSGPKKTPKVTARVGLVKMEVFMSSIEVALWVIAVEIAVVVVAGVIFLLKFSKRTDATLSETQSLVKNLEEKVDSIGKELEDTVKNATGATVHLKKTLENTEKATRFLNTALPIISLVLLWRGISIPFPSKVSVGSSNSGKREGGVMNTLNNIGKLALGITQGYSIYKKYFVSRGGDRNERRKKR